MATKIKSKGWTIVFFTIPSIVGTIIMLTVSREKKGVLLFGYYLVRLTRLTPTVKRSANTSLTTGLMLCCHNSYGLCLGITEHCR